MSQRSGNCVAQCPPNRPPKVWFYIPTVDEAGSNLRAFWSQTSIDKKTTRREWFRKRRHPLGSRSASCLLFNFSDSNFASHSNPPTDFGRLGDSGSTRNRLRKRRPSIRARGTEVSTTVYRKAKDGCPTSSCIGYLDGKS